MQINQTQVGPICWYWQSIISNNIVLQEHFCNYANRPLTGNLQTQFKCATHRNVTCTIFVCSLDQKVNNLFDGVPDLALEARSKYVEGKMEDYVKEIPGLAVYTLGIFFIVRDIYKFLLVSAIFSFYSLEAKFWVVVQLFLWTLLDLELLSSLDIFIKIWLPLNISVKIVQQGNTFKLLQILQINKRSLGKEPNDCLDCTWFDVTSNQR